MIVSNIIYFGKNSCMLCDGKCEKAWGINSRPKEQLSDNIDDYVFKSDEELGEAPKDPGTYEGGHCKPQDYSDPSRHNKWCARECERSVIATEEHAKIELEDFSEPNYNRPQLHE